MRYFFHLAYRGTRYSGWQKHPGILSVQETIESSLSQVLKFPVEINGCGRTDAGVHASQFFFHIDLEENFSEELLFRLNKTLPNDISIFNFIQVEKMSHARFDAYERTYNYYLHLLKDPFLSSLSSYYDLKNLNLENMNQAIKLLLKYSDYGAFCKSPLKYEHTRCHIRIAKMYVSFDRKRLRFEITSNRFLTGMIRIIIGKILDIGLERWSLDLFEYHLSERITPEIIKPAYAEGLYLSNVLYPYLKLEPRAPSSRLLNQNLDQEWQNL